ncbi:MAG: MotA/TolQ/ExbB proton channel family protein [Bdellovibrionales bacterium]|nr:MotA/TolQ/ExbB proton channel family protein [Bdellovibrionales bacterium]
MPIWIVAAEWAARLVLLVLMGLSVWSFSVMIDRSRAFKEIEGEKGGRDQHLAEARKLIHARDWAGLGAWSGSKKVLIARFLKTLQDSSSGATLEQLDLTSRSFLAQEKQSLEKGLTVLATLGSNAPFIGLFGTVLGIINAFAALADQKGGISSVMSGISEALIATAVGLFVAIPAVVAYNVYSRRLKMVLVDCESLKDLYLSRWK